MGRCLASLCRKLAIKDVAKAGFSRTLCLDGLTVTIQRDGDTLTVTPDGGDAQRIGLRWTRCHFGGLRPWMRCPRCGRRASKLYLQPHGLTFACRYCHQVGYDEMAEVRRVMREIAHLDPSYRDAYQDMRKAKTPRRRPLRVVYVRDWQGGGRSLTR